MTQNANGAVANRLENTQLFLKALCGKVAGRPYLIYKYLNDFRDDILDGSKLHTGHVEKRRSSSIRKTATMGADKIIGAATVATATVSLFPNGMIDAEARVEAPHKKELKEMVSILNISWLNGFFEIRK